MKTNEEKAAKIVDLEIQLSAMENNQQSFNKTLPVLRKIQKLRDSLKVSPVVKAKGAA